MNQNASISGKVIQNDILNSKELNSAQLNSASTNKSAPEAVPNQVIVKLNPGIQSAQISTLQASLGASVLEATNTSGIQLWSIQGDADAAISAHSSNPAIAYIEPNYILRTAATPDDSNFNRHWGLNNTGQTGGTPDADIDAVEAWDITTGSSDVVVGVIDTGVDYNHPDLVDNIWTNPGEIAGDGIDNDGNGYVDDVHGYDFANDDGDPFDDDGHGTHVAGTIAARGNNGIGATGVSWSAQIMGLKFLGADGSGSTFDAVRAIEYATMMKTQYGVNIDVTNNSWGGGGFSRALYDAIEAAGDADQLFVAAAGNSGTNNDVFPSYPASYDLDNIIAVASTDHNDNKSGFSQFGATSVDLGAPGSSIYSTLPNGRYGSLSGTSMASPHVAGVTALLWADDSGLSALDVKDRILASVDPIAALDGITVTGGRLNALQALLSPVDGSGEIHGINWNDLDEDGVRDANEPGLEGWTIYLDDNQNGELDAGELSTVTNGNGEYSFTDLTRGTYTIAEVLQPNWQQTYPFTSSGSVLDESNDTIDTAISSALIPGNSATFSDAGSIGDNSNVGATADVDFIELQLGAGDVVTIDIDARVLGSSLDSVLRLFDSNGTEVALSDDDEAPGESFSFDSYINFTATMSDTYYVGISSFEDFNYDYDPFVEGSNNGTSSGDYEIEITLNGGGNGSLVPGAHTVTIDSLETVTDIDFGNYLAGNPIDGTSGNDSLDGTSGFDIIRGYEGNDRLRGKGNKDILFGDEGRDTLAGHNGDDSIFGGTGNDKAYGGNGDDSIVGGTGNDYAHGGRGMDVLTGVDPESSQPGLGELDRFRGGNDADTFVLGDASGVYYDDGNDGTGGWGDRAHIIDFVVGEDKIQLHGAASDYELKATRNGKHTNIFLNTDGKDERIGFVRNVELAELDLNSSSFTFVG